MRLLITLTLVLVPTFYAYGLGVELQPGPSDGKDAFVNSANPGNNSGDHFHMYVGRSTDTGGTLRAFIEFTGLDPYIADGYECTEAVLELSIFAVNSGPTDEYGVYRVEEDWAEDTVTWDDQPAFGGTPVTFGEPYPGDYPIDVTAVVAEWFDGTADHYGFCIKHEDEASEDSGNFGCSSSDDGAADNRPKLTVTLTGATVEPASLGRSKAAFR
ncbi:MAG: DNRLRE domain-containing protein [Candidatus Coatesbacteria bacterium]|nr:MAG: DNRLRE domain-containing protein [Candidatus Coatesbacteria bacterium]